MIIFKNNTLLNNVITAFNNSVLEFKSNNNIEGVQARINIYNTDFFIYNYNRNWFRFNFIEIAKSIVNTNNFQDLTEVEIKPNDINSYTYENPNIYSKNKVFIEITLINGVKENIEFYLEFIAGVNNLEYYTKNETNNENIKCLLPSINKTNNHFYLKFYEGYPFDITIFEKNNLNFQFLSAHFDMVSFIRKSYVNRIFFSDGANDIVNDALIPFYNGINKVEIYQNNIMKNITLYIDRKPMCENDGIYLKWFNSKGGYSYYLFNKYYNKKLYTSNIGELDNDFYNLNQTISSKIQIGKTAYEVIALDTDLISDNEFNLLIDIFSSPKVYLFTGIPYCKYEITNWLEVQVKNKDINIRDWKNRKKNINFEIELPKRYTQII